MLFRSSSLSPAESHPAQQTTPKVSPGQLFSQCRETLQSRAGGVRWSEDAMLWRCSPPSPKLRSMPCSKTRQKSALENSIASAEQASFKADVGSRAGGVRWCGDAMVRRSSSLSPKLKFMPCSKAHQNSAPDIISASAEQASFRADMESTAGGVRWRAHVAMCPSSSLSPSRNSSLAAKHTKIQPWTTSQAAQSKNASEQTWTAQQETYAGVMRWRCATPLLCLQSRNPSLAAKHTKIQPWTTSQAAQSKQASEQAWRAQQEAYAGVVMRWCGAPLLCLQS